MYKFVQVGLHIAVTVTNTTLDFLFYGRKLGVCVVTMFKVSTVLGDAHCEVASSNRVSVLSQSCHMLHYHYGRLAIWSALLPTAHRM